MEREYTLMRPDRSDVVRVGATQTPIFLGRFGRFNPTAKLFDVSRGEAEYWLFTQGESNRPRIEILEVTDDKDCPIHVVEDLHRILAQCDSHI